MVIIMFSDFQKQISDMQKLSRLSEQFLQLIDKDIDYQQITDALLDFSGAKYTAFNIYDDSGDGFYTLAVSGDSGLISKATGIIGYDFKGKKWENDPVRAAKIAEKTITRFPRLSYLAEGIIPGKIADLLQITFGIGEIILVKILQNDRIIGDFQLFMNEGTELENDYIVEIYSRQVGLVITRKKTELALRESEMNFKSLFENGPIGVAFHKMIYDNKNKPVDYLFLDANKSYLELTGVNPVGMKVTEAFPGIENDPFNWIEKFGNVAKHGSQIRVQQYLPSNNRWYDCVGYQHKPDHFVAAFFEITDKMRTEDALRESETKLKEIVSNISDVIIIVNADGSLKYYSPNLERLYGWTPSKLSGIRFLDFAHPDDVGMLQEMFYLTLSENTSPNTFEARYLDSEGRYRTIEITAANHLHNPYIGGILVNFHDITKRKNIEKDLKLSEEKYRILTENASDVISVVNLTLGKITYVSPSIFQLRGLTAEEALNERLEDTMTPASYESVKDSIEKHIKELTAYPKDTHQGNIEIQQYCKNGDIIWVEISAKYQFNSNSEIEMLIISRNIEQRKKSEREYRYLSYNDQLTGLYNRRFYEEESRRIDTERNYPIALIMVDVNGLKLTNDAFGHQAGDLLLRKVAAILISECHSDEIIARMGGDEFIILLPETGKTKASRLIENIKSSIAKERVENVVMSVSIGFSIKHDSSESMSKVYKLAEDDMYRHKLSESSSMRSKTIDLIMNSLCEKNTREMLHSARVSNLCVTIAKCMNFTKDEVSLMKIAGLMHDIGKIGIGDSILNNPDLLNKEEWRDIRRHSEIGYRILSSANEFSEIADYILEHHERWDGFGYPKGLKGDQISIQARIIGIADSYDSMTSDRSYRKALSEDEAKMEIKANAGRQFDPEIAQIFVEKVLGKEWD
jgi:diguanylate cyclase (GGDEF)-like protein/PAS domain S-box-containing protein